MLRIICYVVGGLRAVLYLLFSGGKISFGFPIKLEKGTVLSYRNNGLLVMGKHVSVCHNASISVTQNAELRIGDNTGIGDNNVIVAREKIVIGKNVMIGPNVCIYDHDHVFREPGIMRDLGFRTAPVIIEDNVWIGAGCIILKGVMIGEGSVVAAGTVVTRDIPANSVVYSKRELVIQDRLH